MTRTTLRRLRTPSFAVVFGSVISTAVGIGQSWVGAAVAYASTAMVAGIFFVGWDDSDAEAVIGGRPDERKQLVKLKAAQLGLVIAIPAACVDSLISAVLRVVFWPYEVIVDTVAVAYLVSVRIYGAHAESTQERASTISSRLHPDVLSSRRFGIVAGCLRPR